MEKVSFEDVGAVTATFMTKAGVAGGQVVKFADNGTVGPCAAGEPFCGAALTPRAGCAAVQVKGFLTVSATGTIPLGWCGLEADGKGGVQKAESGGVNALVVQAEEGCATICL